MISLSRDPRITARLSPTPRPSKRVEHCGGEAGPLWTRGSMAQRPRDRQEHPARIRASTHGRCHPCRRDPARPTPPRAGRESNPTRGEHENQTARVPAPEGARSRRGAGGGPSQGGTGGQAPAPSPSSSLRDPGEHGLSPGQPPGRRGRGRRQGVPLGGGGLFTATTPGLRPVGKCWAPGPAAGLAGPGRFYESPVGSLLLETSLKAGRSR